MKFDIKRISLKEDWVKILKRRLKKLRILCSNSGSNIDNHKTVTNDEA